MFCGVGFKTGSWAALGVRGFFPEFAIHIKMNQNVRKFRVFDNVAVRVQDEVVSRENLPRMYPDQLLSRSCHRLLGSFASPNFIAVTKQWCFLLPSQYFPSELHWEEILPWRTAGVKQNHLWLISVVQLPRTGKMSVLICRNTMLATFSHVEMLGLKHLWNGKGYFYTTREGFKRWRFCFL